MKKIISTILVVLMLFGVLMSCNVPDENVSTGTGSSVETGTSLISDTGTNSSADTGSGLVPDTDTSMGTEPGTTLAPDEEEEEPKKIAGAVYIACIEEDTYYLPEIRDFVEKNEIAKDPYKLSKTYIEIIDSYEELQEIIIADVDESIFADNYVIRVRHNYWDGLYETIEIVGYTDISLVNGTYNLEIDCFRNVVEPGFYPEIAEQCVYYNYLVVPKSKIEHFDGIKNATVNGKENVGNYDFSNTFPHWYARNSGVELLEEPMSWVDKNPYRENEPFGSSYPEYRVVLYFPEAIECKYRITERRIENGNLYLTFEEYKGNKREYPKESEICDLLMGDCYEELADNYIVYVKIKSKPAPPLF